MSRLVRLLVVSMALGSALVGCERPGEDDCKRAVENINKVLEVKPDEAAVAAAVRRCRAQSSKAAVKCMIEATSKEQVEACEGGGK